MQYGIATEPVNKKTNRAAILVGLDVTLILSWGTLYYSLAIVAQPLQADLAIDKMWVFGAFSLGLLVSGLASPTTGRWIDRAGGRLPMTVGSLLAALAFGILAISSGPAIYLLGWLGNL